MLTFRILILEKPQMGRWQKSYLVRRMLRQTRELERGSAFATGLGRFSMPCVAATILPSASPRDRFGFEYEEIYSRVDI